MSVHAHGTGVFKRICFCCIKTLPPEVQEFAANSAIEINQANSPMKFALYQAGEPLPREFLTAMTQKYWGRHGVNLTVGFMDGEPADMRARILQHMNAWGMFCNVIFRESKDSPQVRISTSGTDGYWSFLGTDILHVASDRPTMNLQGFTMQTPDSEFYRVVRHETGHTLGFPHEHKRAELVARIDRQKAITYFEATQGWSEAQVIEQILTPLDNSALIVSSPPDLRSIMCYWLPASVMKDGVEVPGGADIDATDQQFAAGLYPMPPYTQVFESTTGIGSFDLKLPIDQAFAYDHDSSGKLDHVVAYRPGTGGVAVQKLAPGGFSTVYDQPDPGAGIGGFDLRFPADRGFAWDYESTGRLDHLVFFRPGTGSVCVMKAVPGGFATVYNQIDPGAGIGGFDLKSGADKGFAFDYDSSGKLDHAVFYRPGAGAIAIFKKAPSGFNVVYNQIDPGAGIGGFDLRSAADLGFAYDYEGTGRLDHLVFYRPGTGAVCVMKKAPGGFVPVYNQIDPGTGIGGFDLRGPADRAFALDFTASGRLDHLVFYRPGTGAIDIVKPAPGGFISVYNEPAPGVGLATCDLSSHADRLFSIDFDGSGKWDHVFMYRPGAQLVRVLRRR